MKHLSERQIEELTLRLTGRARALGVRVREELAASDQQHYRDLAGAVTDVADEALAGALVDFDTAVIDCQVVELRDIEAAHERMRNGTYGICIDCNDAVAYERLAVYPTARRCVRCQQHREHTYADRQVRPLSAGRPRRPLQIPPSVAGSNSPRADDRKGWIVTRNG
jgi:RNA polymerase-binding transcription factor DksA